MSTETEIVTRLRRDVERQTAALKKTLAEIEYVQKAAPQAAALLTKLAIKRDRQETNLKGTQEYIDLLSAPKKPR